MSVDPDFRTTPLQRRKAAYTCAGNARDAGELAEWLAMLNLDPGEARGTAPKTASATGPRLSLSHSWMRRRNR